MASCDTKVPIVSEIDPSKSTAKLQVIEKFKELMDASVKENSFYNLSKKTIFELSKELNMTEAQRMEIVAGQISKLTTEITADTMQSAITWAKEDSQIGWSTALLKGQAEKVAAEGKLTMSKICESEKDIELKCAQIEATVAGSMRDNGRVDTWKSDSNGEVTCHPKTLIDEGLKYAQTLQVGASRYQILADAYRKSGVIEVAKENEVWKGVSARDEYGHTAAQTALAVRQKVSFEDSKRNHAVNASSQTVGQMVAADAQIDQGIIANYNKGMDYLLQDSVPIIPGGPSLLSKSYVNWTITGSDNTSAPTGSGSLTSQKIAYQITVAATFNEPGSNVRNGDNIILNIDNGKSYVRRLLTTEDITEGSVLIGFPAVKFSSTGSLTEYYNIEMYTQDVAGNRSESDRYTLAVKYNPVS